MDIAMATGVAVSYFTHYWGSFTLTGTDVDIDYWNVESPDGHGRMFMVLSASMTQWSRL